MRAGVHDQPARRSTTAAAAACRITALVTAADDGQCAVAPFITPGRSHGASTRSIFFVASSSDELAVTWAGRVGRQIDQPPCRSLRSRRSMGHRTTDYDVPWARTTS
jgi:hypothetical protein